MDDKGQNEGKWQIVYFDASGCRIIDVLPDQGPTEASNHAGQATDISRSLPEKAKNYADKIYNSVWGLLNPEPQ